MSSLSLVVGNYDAKLNFCMLVSVKNSSCRDQLSFWELVNYLV